MFWRITWISRQFNIFTWKKIENTWKTCPNFDDKKELISQMGNLKQALNQKWALKKVHQWVRFNQGPWLKLHVDMKKELRKNAKYELKMKVYSKLMNKADFEKTITKVKRHRYIMLIEIRARSNYLASEPNSNKAKGFSDNL